MGESWVSVVKKDSICHRTEPYPIWSCLARGRRTFFSGLSGGKTTLIRNNLCPVFGWTKGYDAFHEN